MTTVLLAWILANLGATYTFTFWNKPPAEHTDWALQGSNELSISVVVLILVGIILLRSAWDAIGHFQDVLAGWVFYLVASLAISGLAYIWWLAEPLPKALQNLYIANVFEFDIVVVVISLLSFPNKDLKLIKAAT